MPNRIRNVAIVAHVDHGKTTLVDAMFQQSGSWSERGAAPERAMDNNDLERERGITILAKNTSIDWQGYHINIVDTPGHADFGGEVERILSMVDSVLLLVDAVDGPMPQTRFVTQKALGRGLRPIVVVNKVDRPAARPDWVVDETFDLFVRLGASDEQLDFPILYASALEGWASTGGERAANLTALFETLVEHVPAPAVDPAGPLQMQVSALDYSSYVGTIGIGRIARGRIAPGATVAVLDRGGGRRQARVLQVIGFRGMERFELDAAGAGAGDIVAVTGIEGIAISDTLCDPARPQALPALTVDEPTVQMLFRVNDSPFAGREGRFVTSRQLQERLERELEHNVALRVEQTADANCFLVSGRGEMHLSVLIETMRREGYELAVGKPKPIFREIEGVRMEPFEQLVVDIEQAHQGSVIERLAARKAVMEDLQPDDKGRARLTFRVPARGLIGFRTEFLTATSGTGVMFHVFEDYAAAVPGTIGERANGVLIANSAGRSIAFALFNLQERGRLFIGPGEHVYEGMIIGVHSRGNDLTVNPMKAKQLTNIRAAGSDENVLLTPVQRFDLEQAIEFIDEDELVEVTPRSLRLRKLALAEHERRRAARSQVAAEA